MQHGLGWKGAILSVLTVGLFIAAGGGCADNGPDGADAVDSAEFTTCPDSLVLWEEYSVCVPRVDECENPWELPLIGGGCVAIGPRACPKAWDSDADIDCMPGDLLACPDGFDESEDGVYCAPHFDDDCDENEIPLLGGGCKHAGPDWGEEGEPHFDYCGPGELARPGGGCMMVGPRACPKLWEPEADVDCAAGDVLPCQEGWAESPDGLYCEPVYDECSFGERPILGGGCERVVPLPEDCPLGPFPEVPEGASDVVHVAAESDCTDDCGSASAPHSSIQDAVDAVGDGGVVLVGPGNYGHGVLVSKSISLHGLCAAEVAITGVVQFDSPDLDDVASAGLAIVGAAGIDISGITVSSPAAGIVVSAAQDVSLRDIAVQDSAGFGIVEGSGSSLKLQNVWVHDVQSGEVLWKEGLGLWIEGGAVLKGTGCLIEDTNGVGVTAKGQTTVVSLEETVIRATALKAMSDQVSGVWLRDKAHALLSRCVLEGNRGGGLTAVTGAVVEMEDSVVRGGSVGGPEWPGLGVAVYAGASATVNDSVVGDMSGMGAIVSNPGSKLDVAGSIIRQVTQLSDGSLGWGVNVADSGHVTISGSAVQDNLVNLVVYGAGAMGEVAGSFIARSGDADAGESGLSIIPFEGAELSIFRTVLEMSSLGAVVAKDPGTVAEVLECSVRDTLSSFEGDEGHALGALLGASLVVDQCLLERNAGQGILGLGSGTDVKVSRSVVRDGVVNQFGKFGRGIDIDDGGELIVSETVITGNRDVGVRIGGAGTHASLSDIAVRDTIGNKLEDAATGLAVMDGAALAAARCGVRRAQGIGMIVDGDGSVATIEDSMIAETELSADGVAGRGLQVSEGAAATVSTTLFARNHEVGVMSEFAGSNLVLVGSVVRETLPMPDGQRGLGGIVQNGGRLEVLDSLFLGNSEAGLHAGHPGTVLVARNSIIKDTVPDGDGKQGYGVRGAGGALLSLSHVVLEGNSGQGICLGHPGTDMQIEQSTIVHTIPDLQGMFGRGVEIQTGASATGFGLLIRDNTDAGLLVSGDDSRLKLFDSLVQGTLPDSKGAKGTGVIVGAGAGATLERVVARANTTCGLLASGKGTSLDMVDCAVLGTLPGGEGLAESEVGRRYVEEQKFGDAVFGVGQASLQVSSSLIVGNSRAGIYMYEAAGGVDGSIIADNASYGLALEDCGNLVEHQDRGNHIFGNAFELPASEAANVTTSPKGLPAPPLPGTPELPLL